MKTEVPDHFDSIESYRDFTDTMPENFKNISFTAEVTGTVNDILKLIAREVNYPVYIIKEDSKSNRFVSKIWFWSKLYLIRCSFFIDMIDDCVTD